MFRTFRLSFGLGRRPDWYIPIFILNTETVSTQLCSDSHTFTAVLQGSTDYHTFSWEQIDDSDELLNLVVSNNGLTVSFISSKDHVLRFWIDRGTSYEQYEDFTLNTTPRAYHTPMSGAIPNTFTDGNRYFGNRNMASQYVSEVTELLAYPSRESGTASLDQTQWTLYWASPSDLSLIQSYRIEQYNPSTRDWDVVATLNKNVTKYRDVPSNIMVRLITVIATPSITKMSVPVSYELESNILHLVDSTLYPDVHAITAVQSIISGGIPNDTINTAWNLNIPTLQNQAFQTNVPSIISGGIPNDTINTVWNVDIPTLQNQAFQTNVLSIISGGIPNDTINTLWNVDIPTIISIGG